MHKGGKQRVIITNILPTVDNGTYPSKGSVNEPVRFSADVFTDGHDTIAAQLLIKQKQQKKWKAFPMHFKHNDHWEIALSLPKTGTYQFFIQGMTDHFATWKNNLTKKYAAGQNTDTEMQDGVHLIEHAASLAGNEDAALLTHALQSLSTHHTEEVIKLLKEDALTEAMSRYPDEDAMVSSPAFEIEIERERAGFSTWYELFPRSAAAEKGRHGTFKDVKALLPRIAEMGFDVLYLPPIHPIGNSKRKGKNNALDAQQDDPGSPWAIGNTEGGHKSIHPELGTLADLKSLIKEAGKHNIEPALDIAFQCSPDHPYVKEHPEWFKWRADGTVQYAENPPKRYEDILPFNFESEDWRSLWEELKSVIDYWIGQGITIFRIDNPHTKPFGFWEWLISKVRKKNPEVIFLAEAFTRPRLMEQLAKAGFNQSYTYFSWRNTKKELEQYIHDLKDTAHYFRPNFWPNTPDILTHELVEGGENMHIIRLVLAATLSSNYGLYGPVYEFGINTPAPGKEEYTDSEKYEIRNWDWNAETKIREVITRVNRIRRENPALQQTWNTKFVFNGNDKLITYLKKDEASGNMLLIAVNLDPHNTQGAHIQLPLEEMGISHGQSFRVNDLLSGDKYTWQEEWNYIELRPHEMPAHIFKIELQ